jgi:hypothetical protein
VESCGRVLLRHQSLGLDARIVGRTIRASSAGAAGELPLASVLILCEESDIAGCIEAMAQDHPLDRMQLIIVDGCSTDCTREW